MSDATIVVVGSVAYDNVETPEGKRTDQLGGSATYFSISASYFCPVELVAVVGDDFRHNDYDLLAKRGVDISGLKYSKGDTFRWSGSYSQDLNTAVTLRTQLNVFEEFSPVLDEKKRLAEYLFLANINPVLQNDVYEQMEQRPRVVACDTMNLWIDNSRPELLNLIKKVDLLIINETEARQLTKQQSLVLAAENLLGTGLKTLVVKRGEYGAVVFHPSFTFAIPAYPIARAVDPTGAGDSFAGGFMGHLAATNSSVSNNFEESIRLATVVGSVMASFAIESFGTERLNNLVPDDIHKRFNEFSDLTRFRPICDGPKLSIRPVG